MKFNFRNKKIIVTGHTGFKGSWLCLWLHFLGAKIVGVSRNIPTKPSNFLVNNINKIVKNEFCNIQNLKKLIKL
jgi:CDP-glucose 4,6-dehydratase